MSCYLLTRRWPSFKNLKSYCVNNLSCLLILLLLHVLECGDDDDDHHDGKHKENLKAI